MMAWSPRLQRIVLLVLVVSTVLLFGCAKVADAAGPEGQMTLGGHVSLAPTWFDPAETPGTCSAQNRRRPAAGRAAFASRRLR